MLLTIQYLEDTSRIDTKTPAEWAQLLDQAFGILPLTHVLMGWKVPTPVLQACDNVISAHMARMYRWHPLLTSDGGFQVKPDWQVIGLDGNPVPVFTGRQEFAFICPNHPAATDVILNNLSYQLSQFDYQGVFLDRIRYPSPAANAALQLGCFCEHCQLAAAAAGIDLKEIRTTLKRLLATPEGIIDLTLELVGMHAPEQTPLSRLLVFRQHSIIRLIRQAARPGARTRSRGRSGLLFTFPVTNGRPGPGRAELPCALDQVDDLYPHLRSGGTAVRTAGIDRNSDQADRAQLCRGGLTHLTDCRDPDPCETRMNWLKTGWGSKHWMQKCKRWRVRCNARLWPASSWSTCAGSPIWMTCRSHGLSTH